MIEKDQESGENLLLLTAKKTSSDGGVTFITLNTESVSKYFYTVTMDTLEIRNVNSPDTVFKYTKK